MPDPLAALGCTGPSFSEPSLSPCRPCHAAGSYSTPTSTHFTVEGAAKWAVTLHVPEALLGTVSDVIPEPITVAALLVK